MPILRWTEMKKRWEHLADLPLWDNGGRVDLLVGLDHAHLLIATECRVGLEGEPEIDASPEEEL